MKQFLFHITIFGIFLILTAEVFLHITGLASDVMDRELNGEGVVVFKPNAEGYRTRGLRAEVNAHYHINAQGWNSLTNYDSIGDGLSIAIVGDSYIAGFWNDVNKTVAAQLQDTLQSIWGKDIKVHSYGHPGANFLDYKNLIPLLRKKGYKYIYVYLSSLKDLKAKEPSFTGKTKFSERSGVRYWYRKSALLRYLNVNADIKSLLTVKSIFGNSKSTNANEQSAISEGYIKLIKSFIDTNVVIFFDDEGLDQLHNYNNVLKIKHTLSPIDHGFNGHWNVNGNKNAANTILKDLQKRKL